MKNSFVLFFILLAAVVTGQNLKNDYFVCNINNTQDIRIPKSELYTLLNDFQIKAEFTELSVQKNGDQYFLLGKDVVQKWIFAFELYTDKSNLYIDINKHLNACESDKLSLSIFNFDEGRIIGCINLPYHVFGRN